MQIISYTAARSHFKDVMTRVCEDHAPMVITRQNESPVVMMSLEDYNSIEETLYLLRSPANAIALLQSCRDVDKGLYEEHELIEE